MRADRILILGLVIGSQWPLFPLASASEEQIVEAIDCRKSEDHRRLEAQTKDTGCILLYTKDKKTSQIARSVRGVDICLENLKKVRTTLEKAGYKCE